MTRIGFYLSVSCQLHDTQDQAHRRMACCHLSLCCLMFGCCCAGPTFLISGSDLCDSFPLAQGLAHLGLAPSVVGLCSF